MKNRKNLLLVVLLLVVVAVATASTYAWLTDTKSAEAISYTVGDVSYTIEKTNAPAGTYVVPGQALGNIVIKNKSNVKTNVRVQLTVTVSDGSTWTVGEDEEDDEVLLKHPTTNSWTFDETDKCYYYGGKDVAAGEIAVSTNTTDGVALNPLIESLVINGKLVGNDYSGKTITIVATFYAKQADHVTWAEIGSINWTNGI